MKIDAPVNGNYAAVVVVLGKFLPLDGCDSIQATIIFNNQVIVGKDSKIGDVVLFFPLETALSQQFLSANNLYRDSELNADKDKKGFFEKHGRIRCVKLRGFKSEGFAIPLDSLKFIDFPYQGLEIGDTFDKLGEIEICKKYVSYQKPQKEGKQKGRQPRLEDSIVDGQFRLHYDTENLRRNIQHIDPDDLISISSKWHGTSVVISKILVKKELKWYEKIASRFLDINNKAYGLTYSSRRVIKAVNGVRKNIDKNYYSDDIWGAVAREVEAQIPNGFTLYGEIVGFTSEGSPIQDKYHYGCLPKGHKFSVYRVTLTTLDGLVLELSWPQMKEFCQKYGLHTVIEYYYGKAQELFSFNHKDVREWQDEFLAFLEKTYVENQKCLYNKNQVWAEGIVVRKDSLHESTAFKQKSFQFLAEESKFLDKGEVDIETAETL